MHRTVSGSCRVAPFCKLFVMVACVPAAHGEIDPARESQRIVDADNLLMMGSIDGMLAIEMESDARVALPLLPED
jgi:hypothetical protein